MLGLTALGDPTRRKIVELLADGSTSAGDIAREFPISASAISQHLRTLREAKLVRVQVQAQQRIYELDPAGLNEIAEWLARVRGFWTLHLDALEKQLAKSKDKAPRKQASQRKRRA